MTPRETEEYRALRATIRERGTARVWVFVAGLAAWAAIAIATAALAALPIGTLLPLLVLAAVFEAVYALHTGVERVGRYIQVFYEDDDADATGATEGVDLAASGVGLAVSRKWEHTAMAFGRAYPGGGSDPLFAAYFWMAAALNMIPAALAGPVAIEWAVIGAAHVLFVGHIVLARRRAARQRAVDLERFQKLRSG